MDRKEKMQSVADFVRFLHDKGRSDDLVDKALGKGSTRECVPAPATLKIILLPNRSNDSVNGAGIEMQSRRIRQSPGHKTDPQTTEGLGENRLIG